jgi:methyltransferase (TIGR00027 family)
MPDDPAPATNYGTAYWIAAARARESEREDRLFSDPYASELAGTIGRAALEASERASGGENPFLPIRTRFFDDLLETQADAFDQIVLLGAGFDTRAFRLDLPDRLRWFEIDRPEVFVPKERVLGELRAVARCQRAIVATDLARAWSEPLLDAGFRVERRTAWLAEGLLFYLSAEAVWHVLAEARRLSGDGSLVGADVFGSGLLSLPAMQNSLAMRAERGLPPPFTTDDPVATFGAAGWPNVRLAFPGQLGAIYGRPTARTTRGPGPLDPTMQTYLVVALGDR